MTPKQQAALHLRNRALAKLRAEGKFEEIQGIGPSREWADEEISLFLCTPTEDFPLILEQNPYFDTSKPSQMPQALAYSLNIHDKKKGGKVFNMEWDGEGKLILITFKRGDWENKITAPLF